jgi:hypothetical protein
MTAWIGVPILIGDGTAAGILLADRIGEVAGPVRALVLGGAFLLLMWSIIGRLARHEPGGDLIRLVGTPVLCAGAITAAPLIGRQFLESVRGVAEETGYYGVPAARRAVEHAKAWLPAGSPLGEAVEVKRVEPGWLGRLWERLAEGTSLPFEHAVSLWKLVSSVPRGAATLALGAGVGLLLLIGSALLTFAEVIQTALFELGCIFAPLGLAGLCGGFAHQARGLLLKIAGVALWPVGWAAGNLVTFVILDSVSATLNHGWAEAGAGAFLNAAGQMPTLSFAIALAGILVSLGWMLAVLVGTPAVTGKLLAGASSWIGGLAFGGGSLAAPVVQGGLALSGGGTPLAAQALTSASVARALPGLPGSSSPTFFALPALPAASAQAARRLRAA